MSKGIAVLCAVGLGFIQFAAPAQQALPTTYTVTEKVGFLGPVMDITVYREGDRALIDQTIPATGTQAAQHTRTYYDLARHLSYTWQPPAADNCGAGKFSGDWGDPFSGSQGMLDDLAKQKPTVTGAETLNGFATKVYEASDANAKYKVWVDTRNNTVVKAQATPTGGQATTLLEITRASFTAPSASVFALPASCKDAPPPPPSDAEVLAKETGGHAADYERAWQGPGSKDSCSVDIKAVKAETLEPLTSSFQIAVDTTYDVDHPPHYVIGLGEDGRATWQPPLDEMTGQLRGGVLRLNNVPPYFYVETQFGHAGGSSVLIYRHCSGPQSTLLLVVNDPANVNAGTDWLWVKSK